jgi:suppressor for copper-sensitivity B
MRARFSLLPALIVALFAACLAPRADAASPWVRNDHAAVRLIAADAGVPADGRLSLGLEFRLKPGWHIYWRAPGDAGIPPTLDWAGSENLEAPVVSWPLPERYTIFGLTTFVYGAQVVLPIAARVPRPGAGVRARAKVNYLACEKICIPYEASLNLDLVPGVAGAGEGAAQLAAFAARVPAAVTGNIAAAPLRVGSARLLRRSKGGFDLEVLASASVPLVTPDILVEGPRGLRFGLPQHELSADGRSVLFRLPVAVAGAAMPENPRLTITLADRGGKPPNAVEQSVVADSQAAAASGAELAVILAIALLGGLILNLMPCVLPVLSLKLLSVLGHGGEVALVRRGFLATATGIVFSFLVLAAGALALKATGAAVGWGVQFQSPLFLGAMTAVVTLFAANLFGLFDIALPGFAGRLAEGAPARNSLSGAFATGAFATLLATPCSAPFLGTAIGFALTRGWVEIVAVFAALGLGLAMPYLAVAAFPRLATFLPRPGRWMVGLRFVLGLALVATALWLVIVIEAAAGVTAALAAALAAVLLFALLLAARKSGEARPGILRAALAVLVLVGAAGPSLLAGSGGKSGKPGTEAIAWRPFDKVALYNLVAEGRTVFVDVTAEWCVTCKANKALVVERGAVARALSGGKVIAMRADWTRPDPKISAYLAGFGRFGIPFNAVYGPAWPTGIALPELLTEKAVMDAFAAAAGAGPAK